MQASERRPRGRAGGAGSKKYGQVENSRETVWACSSLSVDAPRGVAYYMGGGAEQTSESS